MLSRIKHPIEYELSPTEIGKGKQWLTLKLKNIGRQTLKRLDVELHSLDTRALMGIISASLLFLFFCLLSSYLSLF
jgi:hypothetical protein